MNAFRKLLFFGLLAGLMPLVMHGALSSRQKNTLLGKFFVSNVKGYVTCVSDGRILELKKGDIVLARGAVLETAKDSSATIVFSNQTAVFTDEKTKFTVEKFDQEFFAPNNNLRIEPSNSSTIVRLDIGRVVINTPRLLSGTTMVYETEHAAIWVKGEKLLIEGDEKQTHVAIISGNASVSVRGKDGVFVSIGKRLHTGQEAFVKKTLGAEANQNKEEQSASAIASGAATKSAASSVVAEAVVIKSTGSAQVALPGSKENVAIANGMKLPVNAIVTTDPSSEILIQPFAGVVTTLRPASKLLIEKLAVATENQQVKRQTALFDLKAGTVVSTLDPAKRAINDYGIRTPQGIATAHGTSFSVSVNGDSCSVAVTADSVSFATADGTEYTISAGQVVITPPGGTPQPPLSLAAAVAANPAMAADLLGAFAAVADVVQNNLGGIPPDSAANLIAQVAATVAAALPDQVESITTRAMLAVNATTAATVANAPAASAAVVAAIAAALPDRAVQIAVAAATAVPAQAIVTAAAVAKIVPTQAPQIAAAVTRTFVQLNAEGLISEGTLQNAAALAAAVAKSAPAQSAPVASAVLQALVQAAPQTPPTGVALEAAVIAAAVTTAVPSQAVPVAASMMQTVLQSPAFADASAAQVGQAAATLAGAVSAVVPPQAQQVATAVMQSVVNGFPAATAQNLADIGGLITATVSLVAPDQAAGIAQGVAGAANQPVSAILASAAQAGAQATQIAQQIAAIGQQAASASQIASNASNAANAGILLATAFGPGSSGAGQTGDTADGATGGPGATSIIISQFDPNNFEDITGDLNAAQNAQGEVQFDTTTGPSGEPTVVPLPTAPPNTPVEFQASPANIGG